MSIPENRFTAALPPLSRDENGHEYLKGYVILLGEAFAHAQAYLINGDSEDLVKARRLARDFVELTAGVVPRKKRKAAKMNQ